MIGLPLRAAAEKYLRLRELLTSGHSINPANGCWEWTKTATMNNGYAMVRFDGSREYVHRLSHRVFKGEIPRGLFVCHHCDNRVCINPDHLFAGTAGDNSRDMSKKGRGRNGMNGRFGAIHPASKLSERQAKTILRMGKRGIPQRKIAARFGVRQGTVFYILSGKTWPHLSVIA